MSRLFGIDGVRGTAGQYPLDLSTVSKIGRALPRLGKQRVLIGRDTRASGIWIERALREAISSEGGEVTLAKVITTPGIAFLSRSVPFDAGVVVSASHNPHQDNGIKIFSQAGTKLTDDEEEEIEQMVAADPSVPSASRAETNQPTGDFHLDLVGKYIKFLRNTCTVDTLRPLEVVLDCAHGSSFAIAPRVFTEMGANVLAINIEPDGQNINLDCGSVHPQEMMRTVLRSEASFGVAFDGDSDRCIFCDEKGNLLDGDHVLFILSKYLRRKGQLRSGCVVSTVMANMGLEVALEQENLQLVRTAVGDRCVLEEMLRGNHYLGGEQSGHIIIREHSLAGDGILTALAVAQILIEEDLTLSDLARGLEKVPQVLVNVSIREKQNYSHIAQIQTEIQGAQRALAARGRVVIRYSGTEPLVRIMLEGEEEAQIERHAQAIAAAFAKTLGSENPA